MYWQRACIALLAGVIAAATPMTARADCGAAPCGTPCAMKTICSYEMVPEQYQCTRTVYKEECRQENYTAYRCECIPETRTRCFTVYKQVPEVRYETRCYSVCVPCYEERTIMQSYCTCKPVTKVVRKCVDKGHYECRLVPAKKTLCERCEDWKHRNDCCYTPCCKMKEVKCWVPCPVWEEHTVCCMEKVTECRPVQIKVCTHKVERREEKVAVTCCKCVAEQRTENYTVLVKKLVPFQATRTVKVCVPCQETYTACRMVCRKVEKQVPCCEVPCCCETKCCKRSKKSHCCD